MAGKPKTDLSEKQLKALSLFEAGGKDRKQIAQESGVGLEWLNDLCAGKTNKVGQVAALFKKEYDKIAEKRDENIRALSRESTEVALYNILSDLKEIKDKRIAGESIAYEDKKLSGTLLNAISNNTPAVNIKNLSYSYRTGMTPEEMIHEFVRLKSVAEASFNRRRVQATGEGRPGELSTDHG